MNKYIRLKTLKIREGDNIGQRLKECREFLGLLQREIADKKTIISIEHNQTEDFKLSTLYNIISNFKIKNIQITLAKRGHIIVTSKEKLHECLKTIRITNKQTLSDFETPKTTIWCYENRKGSYLYNKLMKYCKELGIKELNIQL